MKLLVLSNVQALTQPLATLNPLVEELSPDTVVVLGGLFPEPATNLPPAPKAKKMKGRRENEEQGDPTEVVTQLNWLTCPVLVVPNSADLTQPKLVKKVQGQDLVWLRWIQGKGTPVEGWLFVGGGAGLSGADVGKLVGQYELLTPGNVVVLLSGPEEALLPATSNPALVLVGPSTPVPSTSAWVVQVGDVTEKGMIMVDLVEKTTTEIAVPTP